MPPDDLPPWPTHPRRLLLGWLRKAQSQEFLRGIPTRSVFRFHDLFVEL